MYQWLMAGLRLRLTLNSLSDHLLYQSTTWMKRGGPDGPGLQLGTPPRSDHGGPENRTDMLPARHAPDFER